jgi:hypothetical protein
MVAMDAPPNTVEQTGFANQELIQPRMNTNAGMECWSADLVVPAFHHSITPSLHFPPS